MTTAVAPAAVTAATLPEQNFWSAKQLAKLFGVSRRTIWLWVAAGRLPQPLPLSPHCVRWEHAVVVAFVEKRQEHRGG